MPKRNSTPRCASIPNRLDRRRRITVGCLLFYALSPVFVASGQQPKPAPLIWTCDKPFMFGFGSWEKAWKEPRVGKDGIRVVAASGQGGAGIGVLHRNLEGRDFRFRPESPALQLGIQQPFDVRHAGVQQREGRSRE